MRLLGFVLFLSLAPADGRAQSPEARTSALERVSSFLVEGQRGLPDADGRALESSWPFRPGEGRAAPNAAGLVAKALVAMHASEPGSRGFEAARAWGKARVDDVAAHRPLFDADVEALGALAEVTGDVAFRKAATVAFERRHGLASGREIVERLFLLRRSAPALVAFDAAGSMRAAFAVGERGKAAEMGRALALTERRWNVAHPHGFHLTGRAALLAVLEPAMGPDVEALRQKLEHQVRRSQQADGSWGLRMLQATAYSVLALRGVRNGEDAVHRAERFLLATQLSSGGWPTFHDFLPEPFVGETVYEVSAEVALALAASP